MKKTICLVLLLSCVLGAVRMHAEEKVGLKFSGFISTEAIWDSRQNVAARDGEVLLFPKPELLDANGKDVNAVGNFNFINLHSRLKAQTTPMNLWGGKLTATMEVDFMGTANDKKGLVRMRHAFVKYKRGAHTILFGQSWHPFFIPACFPTTASWNVGVPIATLSRNPQLRYTYNLTDDFRMSAIALSQMDFSSIGPKGKSADYIRNSSIPELNIHFEYGSRSRFLLGAVLGTKTLKPRLTADNGNKVSESISSIQAMAYSTVNFGKISCKLQGIYAENGYNLLLLGGYAVKDVDGEHHSYTPIAVTAVWAECYSHYKQVVNWGLFAGYTKNLGAKDNVYSPDDVYARGTNIANLWRVAPRIVFGYKSFKIMAELSQTYAAYGKPDAKLKVQDTKRVGNTRAILHVKYVF